MFRGNQIWRLTMTKSKTTDQVETPIVADEEVATPPSEHTTDVGDGIRRRSSFGKTMYYIDPSRQRLSKGPNQMLGLVKYMLDKGITTPQKAQQGSSIGEAAVREGYVVTAKLTGPVIFAYYIRRMEREQGVEHAATIHAKTGKKMA